MPPTKSLLSPAPALHPLSPTSTSPRPASPTSSRPPRRHSPPSPSSINPCPALTASSRTRTSRYVGEGGGRPLNQA
eukprot:1619773-Rhodomonas_salina.1